MEGKLADDFEDGCGMMETPVEEVFGVSGFGRGPTRLHKPDK
jgi:hypothetical protein